MTRTDEIEVRPLAAADADELSACFRRCYGDSYVPAFFYDPAQIRSRLADRRLESLVATTPAGEIVGHMALMRPHPNALTVELGSAIVDPRYRRHGLLARLGVGLVDLARSAGAVGYHHYQTTAHAIIQRTAGQAGSVETGVMLAYIPAATEYRDLVAASPAGRLAAVTVYQALGRAPARDVLVPGRYASLLCDLYARAGIERDAIDAGSAIVASSARIATDFDAQRSLLRIHVERIGVDLRDHVDALERAHPSDVTQVDLLLSDRAVDRGVEDLRARGFFFCALLPAYAASDVLRLQRLRTASWVRPELVNAQAREVLEAVLADRASACGTAL
jgi:serine/threonine-protein kinase RsbW